MSNQIETSKVKQFSSNIFHLSQQKGSMLRPFVRSESQHAKSAFYDRIGSVTAQKKVGRHSDTTYQDTPHSRRRVTLEDYFHADLVDKEDKLQVINDPTSDYSKAFMYALGRSIDDVLISGALGNSFGGEEGATSISLPNSQKIAAFDGTTTTGSKLNVETLRAVIKKFRQNEVMEGDWYMAITAEQLDGLLSETEVTSSDFNSVKALVSGDVDSFLGLKFVRLERLPAAAAATTYSATDGSVGAGGGTLAAADSVRCFAWKREGILFAVSQDMQAKVTEMPGKHYSTQVYASMQIGCTRLEEEKVIEVLCKE